MIIEAVKQRRFRACPRSPSHHPCAAQNTLAPSTKERARAPPWLSKLCPTKHPPPLTTTSHFILPANSLHTDFSLSIITNITTLLSTPTKKFPRSAVPDNRGDRVQAPLGLLQTLLPAGKGGYQRRRMAHYCDSGTNAWPTACTIGTACGGTKTAHHTSLTSCFRPLACYPFSWRATHSGAVSSNMHHTDEMEHSSVTSTSEIAMSPRCGHDSSERKLEIQEKKHST